MPGVSTRYDYDELCRECPYIAPFWQDGKYDYSYEGQCQLTRAIFHHHGIEVHIQPGRLIPAVPSRIGYLNLVEKVLSESRVVSGVDDKVRGLDVGTGCYGVYALLGTKLFGWEMVGVDIDPHAVECVQKIIDSNGLENVEVRQGDGIVEGEFDFVCCNPPFYESVDDLKSRQENKGELNRDAVVGSETELVCEGGEVGFVKKLIQQSIEKQSEKQTWYSSLLAIKSSVQQVIDFLLEQKIENFNVQEYQFGNTRRWIMFWTFGKYRSHVYTQKFFKNIPVTVVEGRYNLTKVKEVLDKLPVEVEEEDHELRVTIPGIVWSRAYRRNPGCMVKSKHIFVIAQNYIHWLYGDNSRTFQSFQMYIKSNLKS